MKLATIFDKSGRFHFNADWLPSRFTTMLVLVLSAGLGFAVAEEAPTTPPTQVVRNLIQAAKANDLDKVLHRMDFSSVAKGMHGRSGTDAVTLLRSVDLSKAELVGQSTPSAPDHEHVILRSGNTEMRFELKLRATKTVVGDAPYEHLKKTVNPHYVVTEIHPHQ